ncbi:MAG TPA: Hsp20/alpha crystallin family protein [Anaerolineales bacterium]|nr:Hsp20/alpha crystallin family protein [Anaerolineales bacterium]
MTIYISPYRRMATLRDTMNRMFEESISESGTGEREMMLAVDVRAEDEAYEITALVPGLQADDLSIEILNNTVSLRGEFASIEKGETKFLVCELPAGRFSRVITLPTALDPAKAEANIKDGVLRLSVPKAEAHRPKSIKVISG